jgi:hypothetical protein
MYDERNIENNEIGNQNNEETIKSYIDMRTGLIHQDFSWFFDQNLGDDED